MTTTTGRVTYWDTATRKYDVVTGQIFGHQYANVACHASGKVVGFVVQDGGRWIAYHDQHSELFDGQPLGTAEFQSDAIELITADEDGYMIADAV